MLHLQVPLVILLNGLSTGTFLELSARPDKSIVFWPELPDIKRFSSLAARAMPIVVPATWAVC